MNFELYLQGLGYATYLTKIWWGLLKMVCGTEIWWKKTEPKLEIYIVQNDNKNSNGNKDNNGNINNNYGK